MYPAKTLLVALRDDESDILDVGVPESQSLGRMEQPLNPKSWVGPGLE